ncbi:ATPase AAA-type core [Penicillium brevicompactum]|uniref:ATPase AAA-type core n=1 Tax=Penicillium brevicompactum TaxID=5074 RepID=A0A9W9R365_PENBR|nr:ATPase AAA-type core [Penicillium brevicompactum]
MDLNSTRTTAGPLSTSDTAMLEAIVPGFGLISRFLMSYLNFDITAYFQLMIAFTVFGAGFRYVFYFIWERFSDFFISRAEIRLDDEIFNYLMYWVSRQPQMRRANRFVAGIKSNGYISDDEDSDNEDADDTEDLFDLDTGNSVATNENTFDTYWAKVLSRDKYKTLQFTPAEGSHYFWYKNRPMMLTRANKEGGSRYVLNNERLYLSCLGRNPTILKSLLIEAQQAYVERDGNMTVIYRGGRHYPGSSYYWLRCMARVPRPLSTVILDQTQKDDFVDDIKEYLHPRTRRWYSNRGIPYRRGYLLHGPPGTGKTSLCFSAAGLLGLKLYLLDLNSTSLDEESLSSLFSDLPRRCIVLLEDVDSAGITKTRGITATVEPPASEDLADEGKGAVEVKPVAEETKKGGITLSGLLNVIDGVAATEGRILVMTTNHADKLDPALLRPGRVDMTITFGYTSEADIIELFTSIYVTMEGDLARDQILSTITSGLPKQAASKKSAELLNGKAEANGKPNGAIAVSSRDEKAEFQARLQALRLRISGLAAEFAAVVPAGKFTAAEIQGYLLNHKETPATAIEGAAEWVKTSLEKRVLEMRKRVSPSYI